MQNIHGVMHYNNREKLYRSVTKWYEIHKEK